MRKSVFDIPSSQNPARVILAQMFLFILNEPVSHGWCVCVYSEERTFFLGSCLFCQNVCFLGYHHTDRTLPPKWRSASLWCFFGIAHTRIFLFWIIFWSILICTLVNVFPIFSYKLCWSLPTHTHIFCDGIESLFFSEKVQENHREIDFYLTRERESTFCVCVCFVKMYFYINVLCVDDHRQYYVLCSLSFLVLFLCFRCFVIKQHQHKYKPGGWV